MLKMNSANIVSNLKICLVKFLIPLSITTNLFALPTVDQIVAGDVIVDAANTAAGKLEIVQGSAQAIVNWHDFNIGAQEAVHFLQGANGVCLNRINAANGMSEIAGMLSATGKIILINNAGILFTDTASVNVGGIIASAVDTSEKNPFNSSSLRFNQPSEISGAIINRGVINVADNGLVALLGSSVVNDGVIAARYGQVLLEAGQAFTLDFNGDGVLNFAIDMQSPEPTRAAVLDEKGKPIQHAVDMTGQIINDYGNVVIMANAAPGIFDKLINMSGEIRATHLQKTQSGVLLIGAEHGVVDLNGKIDVAEGGGIVVVGNEVNIADTAKFDGTAGWLALGDTSGKVKKFDLHPENNLYVGKHLTTNTDLQIPSVTTAFAIKTFYDYKHGLKFEAPLVNINIIDNADKTRTVEMDLSYNGANYHLRSIRPEDYMLVQTYLNSQPLVRSKYANRQTVDVEATKKRVQTLADRFNQDVTDGCYMHGGFIITDKDTNQFLGMINSGTSLDKGITEIAGLSRPDAWSHKPVDLKTAYNIPEQDFLQKEYNGLASAMVSAIVQYTEQLKNANITIRGDEITAIRAHALVENTGGWKALAKNGFDLDSIRMIKDWGTDVRYRLEHKF